MTQLPNRPGLPSNHQEVGPYSRYVTFPWRMFSADSGFGTLTPTYPETFGTLFEERSGFSFRTGEDSMAVVETDMPPDYNGGPMQMAIRATFEAGSGGDQVALFAAAKHTYIGNIPGAGLDFVPSQLTFDGTGLGNQVQFVVRLPIQAVNPWQPDCRLILFFGRVGADLPDDHDASINILSVTLYY